MARARSQDPTRKVIRQTNRRLKQGRLLGILAEGAFVSQVVENHHGTIRAVIIAQPTLDGCHQRNPATQVGNAIQEALDPMRAPSKGRSLAEMSTEEQTAMGQLYGGPIKMAKLRVVHLQRAAVPLSCSEGVVTHWWLCPTRKSWYGRTHFISLGPVQPRGDAPLDIVIHLRDGTYTVGCGRGEGAYRDTVVVDEAYPEVNEG